MAAVEVIIPYYQRQPGVLARALDSAFRQDVPDMRVIIVDDASPHPASLETEGLTPAQQERITTIVQPNGGAGSARNTGLEALSEDARFVAFLDSDDEWAPDHLRRALSALSTLNGDFYWDAVEQNADFAENYASPTKMIPNSAQAPARLDDDPSAATISNFPRVLCGQWFRHMHLSSTVVSADLARRVRFDMSLRLCEDFDFFRRCAMAGSTAIVSDAVGVKRGAGENLWHGADTSDERYALEKYCMMKVLRRLKSAASLDADDRHILELRLAGCRERFYWGQRDRLRARRAPNLGLWFKWAVRDPVLISATLRLALKLHPTQGRTLVPGDDEPAA